MIPFALNKHDSESKRIRELTPDELRFVSGAGGERMTTYSMVGYETIGSGTPEHPEITVPKFDLDDFGGLPGTNPGIGG